MNNETPTIKELYTHPQETWDEKKCKKMARYAPKDNWGNRPPKGIIAHSGSVYVQYGHTVRWNGGKIIDGELYEAEYLPLPEIPKTYEFVPLIGWGTRIQLRSK